MTLDIPRRLGLRFTILCCAGGLLLTACVTEPATPPKTEVSRLDRSLYQAAESFEQRRDYATAVSYYRNLYRRNASDVGAAIGLSRGLRQLRQAREAQAIILRALKGAPKDLRLRAELGKVQLALGEPLKAVDSLSRVDAEATIKRWDIKVALAIAYDSVGMYEQAERRYRQALDISPENAVVMNNFALSLAQSGKLPEALEILERAASLPEATPRMRQNLALLYAMKGDLTSAEQYVRRDMPPEIADQNMVYYRQLREGMAVGSNVTPALSKPPLSRVVAKGTGEKPQPVEIIATEVVPKSIQAPKPAVKIAQDASENPPAKAESEAKMPAKAEPEAKMPAEKIAVAEAATMTKTDATPKMAAVSLAPKAKMASEAEIKPASEQKPEAVVAAEIEDDADVTPEKDTMAETNIVNSEAPEKPEMPNSEAVSDVASKAVSQSEPAPVPVPASAVADKASDKASGTAMEKPKETGAESSQETAPAPASAMAEAKPEPEPETAAEPEPELQVAAVQTKGFRLQLGSFRVMDGAETLRQRLLTEHKDLLKDVDLVVETVTVPGRGDFFRLHSRPVPDREMVDETCLKLAIRDVPCLLVQVP